MRMGWGDGTTNFRFGDSLNKMEATNRARVFHGARPRARPALVPFFLPVYRAGEWDETLPALRAGNDKE